MNRLAIPLLLALAAAGCAREQDGVIAFQSNRDGNFEIYTMDAQGGAQRRLTENAANDIAPCWSPDGTRIAFASDRDGTWDIYTMRGDGSDLKQLTKGAGSNTAPSWTGPREKDTLCLDARRDLRRRVQDERRRERHGKADRRHARQGYAASDPGREDLIVTVNNRARLSIAAIDVASRKTTLLTSRTTTVSRRRCPPRGSEICSSRTGTDICRSIR